MKLLDIIAMLVVLLGSAATLVVAFPLPNQNKIIILQSDQLRHVRRDNNNNIIRMMMTTTENNDNNNNHNDEMDRRDMIHNCFGAVLTIGAATTVAPKISYAVASDLKPKPKLGGLPNKIRKVGGIMDELQRDLMQERWDLVEKYPPQLRSLVPIFTTYTDAAFPSEAPSDAGLRVALRYEVGRFFGSLERLKQATNRRALNEAYLAYSDMSLHYDRYLHVGGLYSYYDATIDNEPLYANIPRSALTYADPVRYPPEVRDLVILVKGPDMGKIGILIGLYDDGSGNCVVKLDQVKGMRDIKVVSKRWVAKRLGEQDPDGAFLIPRK
eukprot:CAMPEP_0197826412 /NCGR_PEP_ID=MMETSP1437-20131217/3372_1 /TAXON_ID=49252 ORGANISM="Eucampia antarctica, Strain CCMP1452" /NCGR_SAMPLE_ID=MMETSP1437 /ASSEMBLY_ACC=CAM_ASM_001096 /LENGTH=325 /DNA_ID=CAMNT_0043426837 /DNA_START=35 /DNA_END=1012 /DNA_ORIENTATION=+